MKNILILFIIFTATIQAYTLPDIVKKVKTEQRIALIIGNNNYTHLPNLKNPLNDAKLMRETLKKNGFTILYRENAKIKEMKKLLKKFFHRISKGGVGLYYFAGHSANVDGKNYLVGTEASLDRRDYISHEAISLNTIIKKMRNADNRLNVIVSDTCRNTITVDSFRHNHFGRGVGKGLLSLSNTKGIFIAYSTADGEVNRDGEKGTNGILTRYLVQNLKKEGTNIMEVFKNTKSDVDKDIDSKRSPNDYNKITKDFFFILPTKKQKKNP